MVDILIADGISCFDVALGYTPKWFVIALHVPLWNIVLSLVAYCLFTEMGFLALFLRGGEIPHPVVAFAFRWLLFRLMIGFG